MAVASASKRYTGLQPQYFPRLHYMNRILNTDVFMVRDEVQHVKSHKYPDGQRKPSYQAHAPIKNGNGLYVLNLPVEHDGLKPIYQTRLGADESWRQQHLKTIYFAYSKAPLFETIYPQLERLVQADYPTISDLNNATTLWAIALLAGMDEGLDNLEPEAIINQLKQHGFRLQAIEHGSNSRFYKRHPGISANQKLVGLIKEVGANENYCGGTAKEAYMDIDYFEQNGIKIVQQDWTCPEYPQQFVKNHGFIPNLSIIDLLMNVPVDQARAILRD